MSNDYNIQNNITYIANNITYFNSETNNNNSKSNLFLNNRNDNYFLLSIILVLFILLIISILIIIFLLKKKKKINFISNNIGLNKIVINNSNNNQNKIIDQKGGFQKVQNTSKVNDLVQPNNALNEIKTYNLGEEIHKIVHSSLNSSFTTFGGKRLNKKKVESNLNTSGSNFGKEDLIFGNKNILLKKENKNQKINNINTQKLEQELKQQIKKYVIEDVNI